MRPSIRSRWSCRIPGCWRFYVIAIIATCWHFAYGIWLFSAKWGITPGDKARRKMGYVCTGLGVVMVVIGLASLYAFVGPNTGMHQTI